MAATGSWPSIAAEGLLPTRDIVASSALTDAERAAVLTQPRPRPVHLDHSALGAVTLRDQSPLHGHILEAVLIEMTVPQWLATLNDRIYFWLHPQRLASLLQSRPNRGAELAVIGGVPDIADHVVRVQRRHGLDVTAELSLTPGQCDSFPVLGGSPD